MSIKLENVTESVFIVAFNEIRPYHFSTDALKIIYRYLQIQDRELSLREIVETFRELSLLNFFCRYGTHITSNYCFDHCCDTELCDFVEALRIASDGSILIPSQTTRIAKLIREYPVESKDLVQAFFDQIDTFVDFTYIDDPNNPFSFVVYKVF